MNTTCNPCADASGQGNALAAPRRNRYFYGKLLDVPHMQMEQDYGKLKRWLINRLSLGTGVLCGLDVVAKDGKICVSGGVAIDSFGREIIVPATYCIDPWKLPGECGNPDQELDRDKVHLVQLQVCYRECLTDQSPVQVSDCSSAAACEAGTTIESFQFQIVEGVPARAPSDICELMHLDGREPGEIRDIPAIIRQRLCEKLPHPCVGDKDCCVLLAVIELLPDGRIGKVQACAARTVLYSNAMLFEMILCLTARIEQCCGGDHPQPPPPPPPPPPRTLLRVEQVAIFDPAGAQLATYVTPNDVPSVPMQKRPFVIKVTFTGNVSKASVVTGNSTANWKSFSFLVQTDAERFTKGFVPGIIKFPSANIALFIFEPDPLGIDFLPPGKYTVTLFGDPDPANNRPAISSDVDPTRLDGDPIQFPSGNGVEGGAFTCTFTVVDR
jgi:hypothetical protein